MVTQRTIRAMARKIGREFHPRQVVLFGSYARGEATEDSDVDLLVVMDRIGPPGQRSAPILKVLALNFLVPADVIVESSQTVERYRDIPGSFTKHVLDEGVVLYEGKQ